MKSHIFCPAPGRSCMNEVQLPSMKTTGLQPSPPLGERVASAPHPGARTVQSFEGRSGFGRRGVASRVRGRPGHCRTQDKGQIA